MRTIERLVEQEIICNVSHLVATLASNCAAIETGPDCGQSLESLAFQAMELAMPIDEWEEAATQAGWNTGSAAWSNVPNPENYWGKDGETHPAGNIIAYKSAQECCEDQNIEPYQREVFEHWFVTDWLADRLEAKGEKVDKDFAGHCVWARTTTGQGIAPGSVIEAIYADIVREYGER